jgi:hypothetical protein
LVSAGVKEEVIGIKVAVPEILESEPVEGIRAALGCHRHDGAGRSAEFRRIRIRYNTELLDGIDRRPRR